MRLPGERHERDRHRLRDVRGISDWRQRARLRVDTKDDQRIRALVGGDEITAGRVDREIAGGLAERRLMAGSGELAGLAVDVEDGDVVGSARRRINVTAVGRNGDLSGVAVTVESGGERRDG